MAEAVGEVMAEVGSEKTMPVQASEADAAQLHVVAPAHAASAAAEQLADVQTAMPQSPRWAEDSCEEDWCVAEDYFSTSLPWKQPQQAKYSVEPAAAALNEAAALMTQEETTGSGPGAELVNPAMEGVSQLSGMMFGAITAADLLGAEGSQHVGSLAAASPTAPAAAPATAPAVIGASGSAAAGSTAVAASHAGGVSMHTAVARLGTTEDKSGAAAAGTVEGNASVSQLGSIRFGTITAADLLAASVPTADASLGMSEDRSGAAAAGTAEGNASVAQFGGIRFGTITAVDVLAASMHTADASLGTSEDRLHAAAAGAAEHTDSRSQLSSSNHDSFRLTNPQTAVSHDGKEDCKEDGEHEAHVNTSLGYTAFVTDSLLGRIKQQAGSDGGSITALDVRNVMDLMDWEGPDNQAWYNYALLGGVNEQLAAAKHRMQPPAPAMQQLTPLRRPPSTPRAVACAVHDDIMCSVHLAEAPIPDGVKHSRLLCQEAKDHQKSVDEGTARAEASIKIAIADSIFDDLMEDTALAFLDAHGLQEPPEPASD